MDEEAWLDQAVFAAPEQALRHRQSGEWSDDQYLAFVLSVDRITSRASFLTGSIVDLITECFDPEISRLADRLRERTDFWLSWDDTV